MRTRTLALLGLLPLLTACQSPLQQVSDNSQRMQGLLTQDQGQLVFSPCSSQSSFVLHNPEQDELQEYAAMLFNDGNSQLLADVQATAMGESGLLHLDHVYRLQGEGGACNAPRFAERILEASGQEPGWFVGVSPDSLLLMRAGEESLAVPYVIESLPQGRISISSEAQGLKIELWTAPQACQDSMSGAYSHLSAQLRINGEQLNGCANYGGAYREPSTP